MHGVAFDANIFVGNSGATDNNNYGPFQDYNFYYEGQRFVRVRGLLMKVLDKRSFVTELVKDTLKGAVKGILIGTVMGVCVIASVGAVGLVSEKFSKNN